MGIYGSRGDEVLTEDATVGDDFLAEVCVAWEQAADPAREAGIRVVHPRTGVVIAEDGPLIDKVELPFRLGVEGREHRLGQRVPHGRQLLHHGRDHGRASLVSRSFSMSTLATPRPDRKFCMTSRWVIRSAALRGPVATSATTAQYMLSTR